MRDAQRRCGRPEICRESFPCGFDRTLQSTADWANELHPGNDGFKALAEKIDDVLQTNMS
ncbi:MAG: hypothetical protein WCK57_09025 [Verrucomicrobiae bacterium]